MNKTKKTRRDQ
jgi:chromosome segregation ATPase